MQEKFDRKDVDNTEAKAELGKKLTQKYLLETSAFYISSRVLDDGIILPQHTRQVSTFLFMCHDNEVLYHFV
jgi:acetyl-CoA carboxylase carboxyltransferase component